MIDVMGQARQWLEQADRGEANMDCDDVYCLIQALVERIEEMRA